MLPESKFVSSGARPQEAGECSPRVSIGLPVYNGANFLSEALLTLLGQTFPDFELIVSDNGSDDGTADIVQAHARRDARIRYYRNAVNRGAAWNFNRLVELARGEYFMWAAHDDVWAPDFIARCVESLDAHPECVLCYSRTQVVGVDRTFIKEIPVNPRLSAPAPHRRFAAIWRYPPQVSVFGLIRMDALRNTRLIGDFPSADRVLAGELALAGPFVAVDEPLFFYRRHDAQSTGSRYTTKRSRCSWYNPLKAGRPTFPQWRLLGEHLRSILRMPLPLMGRLRCLLTLLRWSVRFRRELASNLILQDAQRPLRGRGQSAPSYSRSDVSADGS